MEKHSSKNIEKSAENTRIPEAVKAIADLKQLYLETIKLDVELEQKCYRLEKALEKKYHKVSDKRSKIIQNLKAISLGIFDNMETCISNFWLEVLKGPFSNVINRMDEKIMSHLIDVRSTIYTEPTIKFIIEFIFEPNEYLSNHILTKTYFVSCLPDLDNPLSYDGAQILKTEGCKINWKEKGLNKEEQGMHSNGPLSLQYIYQKKVGTNLNEFFTDESFFDFFNPPQVPDDPTDPNFNDIRIILMNDFEVGYYLKESVIPKAIMFYTGEIAEIQSKYIGIHESDDDA